MPARKTCRGVRNHWDHKGKKPHFFLPHHHQTKEDLPTSSISFDVWVTRWRFYSKAPIKQNHWDHWILSTPTIQEPGVGLTVTEDGSELACDSRMIPPWESHKVVAVSSWQNRGPEKLGHLPESTQLMRQKTGNKTQVSQCPPGLFPLTLELGENFPSSVVVKGCYF